MLFWMQVASLPDPQNAGGRRQIRSEKKNETTLEKQAGVCRWKAVTENVLTFQPAVPLSAEHGRPDIFFKALGASSLKWKWEARFNHLCELLEFYSTLSQEHARHWQGSDFPEPSFANCFVGDKGWEGHVSFI